VSEQGMWQPINSRYLAARVCLLSAWSKASKYPLYARLGLLGFTIFFLSTSFPLPQLRTIQHSFGHRGLRNASLALLYDDTKEFSCEPDREAKFVFYNRLPKSGSSTILNITKYLRNNGTLMMVGHSDPDTFYHPYGLRPIHDYIYYLEAEVSSKTISTLPSKDAHAHHAVLRHIAGRSLTSSPIGTRTLST
jgi:hypothetical protein